MPYADVLDQAAERFSPAPAGTNYFDPAESENIISRYANTRARAASAGDLAEQSSRLARDGFDRQREGQQRVEWDRSNQDHQEKQDFKAQRFDLLNKIYDINAQSDDFPDVSSHVYKTVSAQGIEDPGVREAMAAKQHQHDQWKAEQRQVGSVRSQNAIYQGMYGAAKFGATPEQIAATIDPVTGEHDPIKLQRLRGELEGQYGEKVRQEKLDTLLYRAGVPYKDRVVNPETGATDYGATMALARKNGLDMKTDAAKALAQWRDDLSDVNRHEQNDHSDVARHEGYAQQNAVQQRGIDASSERQKTGIEASKERAQSNHDYADRVRAELRDRRKLTDDEKKEEDLLSDLVKTNEFFPNQELGARASIDPDGLKTDAELKADPRYAKAKYFEDNKFPSEMAAAAEMEKKDYVAKGGANLSDAGKRVRERLWEHAKKTLPQDETQAAAPTGKVLTAADRDAILKEAGGDRKKAIEIAKERGYTQGE
jgi:hypothetical protein